MVNKSGRNIEIEVDGGINKNNAKAIINTGANVLVAGSAVFQGGKNNYAKNIEQLRII